jgi:colicin import membrane protein
MTTATLGDRRPRLPRSRDNLPTSFGLALLMHGLLFVGMTLAVQWRTQPAAPIVAELWSSLPPQQVIDVAPPPPPPPPPRIEPEPEREAEIALKVEKKPPPKIEPKKEEKKPEPKKEEKKPEPKKEPPKEVKKVDAKKEEPPGPRTDMERLMAQAGAAPAPGGAPTAGATASGVRGSDGGYSALVIACVRPHIAFVVPEGTGTNVYADFRVELLPDGAVASVRLVRASGLAGYDAAAERAIRRCDPFPRKRDGTIDRTIDVRMYPVEPR